MKMLWISVLVCCTAASVWAQPIHEVYDSHTIYLVANGYYLNGERHPFGFFGNRLKKEMEVSREGMVLFTQYQRQRVGSAFLSVASVALISSAILTAEHERYSSTLFAGAIGCFVISIPLTIRSTNALHRSIWIRNRDVLDRRTSAYGE